MLYLQDIWNIQMEYNATLILDFFNSSYIEGKIPRRILKDVPVEEGVEFKQAAANYIVAQHADNPHVEIEVSLSGHKPYYCLKSGLMSYLYLGLLANELSDCYDVKPRSVHEVFHFMKETMEDKRPMIVLRTDIVQFVESMSFDMLIQKIEADGLLCSQSIELLKSIDCQYRLSSNSSVGLPRGILTTSILSEIFMSDFDKFVWSIDGICEYGRIGDDIVIFALKDRVESAQILFDKLKEEIKRMMLTFHEPDRWSCKTELIDDKNDCLFYYMGYHIEKTGAENPAKWMIDDAIAMNSMFMIKSSVDTFLMRIKTNSRDEGLYSPLSQLLQNIRFLTSNYRKRKGKARIKTGIHFSLPQLNSFEQLAHLDKYCEDQIRRITADMIPDGYMGANVYFSKQETADYIVRRCLKYTVTQGYKECKMSNRAMKDLRVSGN